MSWLRKRLNKDAKRWHKLWSTRATLFWAAFNCGIGGLDLLAGTDVVASHPLAFVSFNAAGHMTIFMARLYKQPGLT